MSFDFDHILAQLQAAQGNPQALTLATLNIVLGARGPGALASMVSGIVSYGVLSQWGIKLAGLHAIVPSLTLALVVFITVSLLTAPPSREVRELFGQK